jgi:hypothetical protein
MDTLILLALCQLGPVGAPPEGALPPAAIHHVDLTNDGALDRLRVGLDGTSTVAIDVGGGRYQDVWQVLPRCVVSDVLASDLDEDGQVDLYLVSPTRNLAMLGDGTGRLTEATARLGLADQGCGLSAERLDADGDGWRDLLLHNANGEVLFRALPGRGFERVGPDVAGASTLDASTLLNLLLAASADSSLLGDGVAITAGLGADGQLTFGLLPASGLGVGPLSTRPPKTDAWRLRDGPPPPTPPTDEPPVYPIIGHQCDRLGLDRPDTWKQRGGPDGPVRIKLPGPPDEPPPVFPIIGHQCDGLGLDPPRAAVRGGFPSRLNSVDTIAAEPGTVFGTTLGQRLSRLAATGELWKLRGGPDGPCCTPPEERPPIHLGEVDISKLRGAPVSPIEIVLPVPPEELPVLVGIGHQCGGLDAAIVGAGQDSGSAQTPESLDDATPPGDVALGEPAGEQPCVTQWPGLGCAEGGLPSLDRQPQIGKQRSGSMRPLWIPTIPIDLIDIPPLKGLAITIRIPARQEGAPGRPYTHTADDTSTVGSLPPGPTLGEG